VVGLLLAVATLGTTSALGAVSQTDAAPRLWAGLTPGPYRVGYRLLDTPGGVIHTWYPTSAAGQRLLFREYLGDGSQQLAEFLAQAGVSSSTIDSLFASPLYAVPSPNPIDQPFPLVLIAQGNGHDAIDQVVLCEYLASQGFVVATTPSPMLQTPLEREDQVGALAEKQASELAAAIDAVTGRLRVDAQHLGVVGHSFGARAALLLAMRDPRVRAIVSLDGGIGTATAVEPFRRAPSFRPGASLPPLLHFFEELDPFMTPDFKLLRSLDTAQLFLEPTEGMHHTHFTVYGSAAAVFPELAAVTHATSATPQSVVAVAEQTATFLRCHLVGCDL
jgi:dienelactone hydrolase